MDNSLPDKSEPEKAVVPPVNAALRKKSWRFQIHILLVILISMLVFIPGISGYGVIDPSEGLYAEGAREMLERSDLVTPSFNYQPFFEQPVLIYWLIMFAYKMFGVSEIVARLPIALCGIASALGLYVFCRPFLGPRASFFATLSLLSTPLFVGVGKLAITDMPLTLFMMLASLGLFARLHGAHWISLAMAYAALGLALLVKGPLSVLIVVALTAIYMFCVQPKGPDADHRWWWHKLHALHPFLGSMVVLSVALPWYLFAGLNSKGGFYQEFFIRQQFNKILGDAQNQNPVWYYVPVYFGGFFPWSMLTLVDIRRYAALLRKPQVVTKRSHLELFSLLWLLLVLVVFTLFGFKLLTFILPAAPPLAILSGSMLDRVIRFKKSKQLGWILVAMTLIVLPGLAAASAAFQDKLGIDFPVLCAFVGYGFFVWCFLVIALRSAFRRKTEAAITAISCACAFASATFVPTLLQWHYVRYDRPLFLMLRQIVMEKAQVAIFNDHSAAAIFYLRRPIKEIRTQEELRQYSRTGKRPHYLLITREEMNRIGQPPMTWTLVATSNKWHMFKVDSE